MTPKSIVKLLALTIVFCACKEPKNTTASVGKDIEYVIDEAAISRLDSTLKSYVDAGTIAGISTLIYEKDKEVYYRAYGYSDLEKEIPMARNTIVQIYSMTKPITGTALMTLYDKKMFKLDDPLEKYAPEFKDIMVYSGEDARGMPILEAPKRPITVRDLTRHTAGFGRNANIPGLGKLIAEADALNRENTLVQMAEKMGATPLYFHPGEQWEYGPCVDVQAFLVERLSGMAYKEYVRKNVLDPLGMKTTRYFVPEEDRDRFSAMYLREDNGTLRQLSEAESKSDYLQKWPLTRGGSGLTSTLDDYMRFARMLVKQGKLDGVSILQPGNGKVDGHKSACG